MRRVIHPLEQPRAKWAIVDTPPGERQVGANAAIDPSGPLGHAKGIEFPWMLAEKHCLCLTIAHLLFEVGFDGLAAMMPHDGGRTEANSVAAILQPPADIHIVPGGGIRRIKPPHLGERRLAECHVTTWDVLCGPIVEQNMR